jgi:hypothetical protein
MPVSVVSLKVVDFCRAQSFIAGQLLLGENDSANEQSSVRS